MAFSGILIMSVAANIRPVATRRSGARGLNDRERVAKPSQSSHQMEDNVTNQDPDHARSNWQLQDAKARSSELVKKAREQGPQHVTIRGEPAVVEVSEEDFTRLNYQSSGRMIPLGAKS
jgi:prevent-host-death family protein